MRIVRVLRCGALEAGDLEPPRPVVALVRDGAVYDVGLLDRRFGTAFSPERFGAAFDFHTRVFALGCAGLAELDRRLAAGDRPTEARVLPGSFVALPPCDPERATYVQMAPYELGSPDAGGALDDPPRYRLGNARALLGHDATVPFPAGEERPDFELGIAAVLGEDVFRASACEALDAILGYAILNAWTARDEEVRCPVRARDFAVQLGPELVTRDEIVDVAALRAQARVDGELLVTATVGSWRFHVAEAVAFVSDHVELRAGDVIGAGRLPGGSAAEHDRILPYGAAVELRVDRLGKLSGRAVRGPPPVSFRLPGRSPTGVPPPSRGRPSSS